MVKKIGVTPSAAGLALVAVSFFPGPTQAQGTFEPTIHWAYASFFGTGWYRISDEQSGFIMRVSPSWDVGVAELHEDGRREIAYRFRLPMTLGVAQLDFNDIPGIIDRDNFSTASLGLSLDADIPVSRRFSIRPSAEAGYATILDEDDNAWTYRADLRTRTRFRSGALDWAVLVDFGLVGYEPNRGNADDFTYVSAGLEFGYPVSWFSTEESQTMFYWHLNFVEFINDMEFRTGVFEYDSIANYWQGGFALGKRESPISVWFLEFDRLGLAYNYSASGQLRGIKFVFRSLYDL